VTTEERLRAFALRCEGMTWEDIGALMHYDPKHVAKELHTIVEKMPHQPDIIFPEVAAAVRDRYGNSIENLAVIMHVSPHRLRRVLTGRDAPTETLVDKLCRQLCLDKEVIDRVLLERQGAD